MNDDCYDDPETGYLVFTEGFHLKRGTCCGSSCRHCPFGHERVDPALRRVRSWAPSLYPSPTTREGARQPAEVLISGGALTSALKPSSPDDAPQIWVTLFNPSTQRLKTTGTPVGDAIERAWRTRRDLLLIPSRSSSVDADALIDGLRVLQRRRRLGRITLSRHVSTALRSALTPWAGEKGVEITLHPPHTTRAPTD